MSKMCPLSFEGVGMIKFDRVPRLVFIVLEAFSSS